jgi:hypothetical protein
VVMRSPSRSGYRQIHSMRRGERLDIQALPGPSFSVEEVLGPELD